MSFNRRRSQHLAAFKHGRHLCSSTLYPQMDSHDGKVGRDKHRTRQIRANAHESVLAHQQVKVETLVEVLEQIIETAKRPFNDSTHGHLILPALAVRLDSEGIDVIGHETAVWTGGMSNSLLQHASKHRLLTIGILARVLKHSLNIGRDAHLATGNVDNGIDEVEIGELAVDPVVYNV